MIPNKVRISLLVIAAILIVVGIIAGNLITRCAPFTATVQTKYGPIRGEELTFEGTNYKSFKGIPYAAPPVGNLKFRAPQPPEIWHEVRNTRAYGSPCLQPETPDSSEDCLTLNVFTQTLDGNTSKAVLVWIYGGGFIAGDSTDSPYGPQYLIQEDIVVVTINYRLGPMGFLSTNTSDATGNWGMKDQVAALKWVQENIAQFDGDPNRVTIYGESAGGASVHLHLFSPLSEGLFHRAIPASGTVSNAYVVIPQEKAVKFSKNISKILGASESQITDPAKRVEFLRDADSRAMTDKQTEFLNNNTNDTFKEDDLILPFVPVIEPAGSEGAFLTEDPKKLLVEGRYYKVPLMIGITDNELGGIINAKNFTKDIGNIEKNPCQYLPEPLKTSVMAMNGCPAVAQAIRDTYFDGKSFNSSMLNLAYLFSDVFMATHVHYAQRWHARYSDADNPIYNYYFTFEGKWNNAKKESNTSLPGALHFDDIFYVFKPPLSELPDLPATSPEVITKNRMVRLIANFVKYGNPTPSVSELVPVRWEPATPSEPTKALVIDKDLKMEKDLLKTRMDMWNEIYIKYTRKPLFP